MAFPSLLVRIHHTHQTERGSASPPDAGAHEVPGLQSRGESHGSEVVVVVGSLLCVPFQTGTTPATPDSFPPPCRSRFAPKRDAHSCPGQTGGEAVSHFAPSTTSPQQLGEDFQTEYRHSVSPLDSHSMTSCQAILPRCSSGHTFGAPSLKGTPLSSPFMAFRASTRLHPDAFFNILMP